MQLVNNPTGTDRLCPQLGENVAPYSVRCVSDEFEKCAECQCVVFGGDKTEPDEDES